MLELLEREAGVVRVADVLGDKLDLRTSGDMRSGTHVVKVDDIKIVGVHLPTALGHALSYPLRRVVECIALRAIATSFGDQVI